MGWLIADGTVRRIDAESVKLSKTVPKGVWKICFNKDIGTYMDRAEVNLDHGRIYGDSQKIANHIVGAYLKSDKTKNMGVLLSGGKGLGKSLTTKLVISQLIDKYPIILVNLATPDLAAFLGEIENSVIIMDEFEKTIPNEVPENDSGPSPQETLLSILDGTTGKRGNLYLLTCNRLGSIDENLKSRPGRVRYHYKFDSAKENIIKEYCEDNLEDKSLIGDIVERLLSTRFVSMDIIKAIVDELNDFPGTTIEEVMNYLNIETEEISVILRAAYKVHSKGKVEQTSTREKFQFYPNIKFTANQYMRGEGYVGDLSVNLEGIDKLPLYGSLDITDRCRTLFEESDYAQKYELVKVTIEDENASIYKQTV